MPTRVGLGGRWGAGGAGGLAPARRRVQTALEIGWSDGGGAWSEDGSSAPRRWPGWGWRAGPASFPSAERGGHEAAAGTTWRHGEPAQGTRAALRELVRYATFAPSSHNTQCWKFALAERSVSILPDYSRRCPVVDPDDHHLFVSLGCAAENIVQAAPAMGFHCEAAFDGDGPPRTLNCALAPAPSRRTALFEAIPQRQSTRGEFDSRPLSNEELRRLEAAGSGRA